MMLLLMCLVIQREFIKSLIQDLGADFGVAFRFALPRSDRSAVSVPFGPSSGTALSS